MEHVTAAVHQCPRTGIWMKSTRHMIEPIEGINIPRLFTKGALRRFAHRRKHLRLLKPCRPKNARAKIIG